MVNGSTNILSTLNTRRNISDSYNKTETDGFLNSKVGYVYDSNLVFDSIIVDIIKQKTTQTTPHVKFDCSIAVVGKVNISSGLLKVDGRDIVTELSTKATNTNLNLKANI